MVDRFNFERNEKQTKGGPLLVRPISCLIPRCEYLALHYSEANHFYSTVFFENIFARSTNANLLHHFGVRKWNFDKVIYIRNRPLRCPSTMKIFYVFFVTILPRVCIGQLPHTMTYKRTFPFRSTKLRPI